MFKNYLVAHGLVFMSNEELTNPKATTAVTLMGMYASPSTNVMYETGSPISAAMLAVALIVQAVAESASFINLA